MSKNTTKLPLFAKSASEMFNIFEESIVINRKLAHEDPNFPTTLYPNLHTGINLTFNGLRHTSQNAGKIKLFKTYTVQIIQITRHHSPQTARKNASQKTSNCLQTNI
jgi:hypothetical protein